MIGEYTNIGRKTSIIPNSKFQIRAAEQQTYLPAGRQQTSESAYL
jgi:hypothetical protein